MGLQFALLNAWASTLALALAMLVAGALGLSRGRKARERGDVSPEGKFVDASMALLGLLIAFTFSMALGKYDTRRGMMITDTNAIGDFYTCTTMLPDPARTELHDVLREYVSLRLEVARYTSVATLRAALPRLDEMHRRMTDLVAGAVREGTPIAIPLVNTLNALTSSHAARLAVVRDRLPATIVALLFLAAILATEEVGRQHGASPHPHIGGMLTYIFLVSLAIFVTMDLNQFSGGLIRVNQAPMERLLSSMGP